MGPMVLPAVMMGASVAGSLLGKKKGTTVTQGPLETPEQAAARKRLLSFSEGNPSYTGAMGDYNMTDAESAGQNQLMRVIQGGMPAGIGLANKGLSDLMDGTYDPTNPNGSYAGFKETTYRNANEAESRLRRAANMGGNLYSTATIKGLGNIEGQADAALTDKLGTMYDNYTQNKINAIPMAAGVAQTEQGLNLAPVAAASTYGGLSRQLQTQQFQDAYNEFVRSQNATQGALKQVAGGPPEMGVSSYTMPGSSSPWDNVLNMLGQAGAYKMAMTK